MSKLNILLIGALILFVSNNVLADLIFSAPPRGAEADERAMYEPLVQAMSKAIGEKVYYEHPKNFITYSVAMQKGHYDIVFDGPHFSQWRVENLNHTLLVNLPENLQFLVVAPLGRTKVNTLHDLVYETICAQLTPQLGTLMLLQNYSAVAAQPTLHLVQGEDKVFADFAAGKCTAAVLRDKTFYKMSNTERAAYKVIYKSPVAPNDAITANNKVTLLQRKALIALLTNPEAMKVASPVFDRFSRNAVAFNVAEPTQFKGLDQLLYLTFGWDVANTNLRGTADAADSRGSSTPSSVVGMEHLQQSGLKH